MFHRVTRMPTIRRNSSHPCCKQLPCHLTLTFVPLNRVHSVASLQHSNCVVNTILIVVGWLLLKCLHRMHSPSQVHQSLSFICASKNLVLMIHSAIFASQPCFNDTLSLRIFSCMIKAALLSCMQATTQIQ